MVRSSCWKAELAFLKGTEKGKEMGAFWDCCLNAGPRSGLPPLHLPKVSTEQPAGEWGQYSTGGKSLHQGHLGAEVPPARTASTSVQITKGTRPPCGGSKLVNRAWATSQPHNAAEAHSSAQAACLPVAPALDIPDVQSLRARRKQDRAQSRG